MRKPTRQLLVTDHVIHNKNNDTLSTDSQGKIIIYGEKTDAEKDCWIGESIVRCTELSNHHKETLLNQINQD